MPKPKNTSLKYLVSERVIMLMILLNTVAIFCYSFPALDKSWHQTLLVIDNLCALYFIFEIIFKIHLHSFSKFWLRSWDRFDFILVVITLPSLFEPFIPVKLLPVLMSLRLLRLIRFLKLLKYIPNGQTLVVGIQRALKAAGGVCLSLFILNIVFSLAATTLFGERCPEIFGDPFRSMYAIFQIFTIEGWNSIPEMLINKNDSSAWIFLVRFFFITAVSSGGILGLSLANAIFVDEMTLDNNKELEDLILKLQKDISALHDKLPPK